MLQNVVELRIHYDVIHINDEKFIQKIHESLVDEVLKRCRIIDQIQEQYSILIILVFRDESD